MRYTSYYMIHTFINQVKKIFKKSVIIFILICALVGGLIGFGVAALMELADNNAMPDDFSDEIVTEIGEDSEDVIIIDLDENGLFANVTGFDILELVVGAIVLFCLGLNISNAEKSGAGIFQPGDVMILFPSPLKPQSVLLFRLVMQIGTTIFATLYILFQVPRLMIELGVGGGAVAMIVFAWVLLLCLDKFVQIFFFCMASIHERIRPFLTRGVLGFAAILVVAYIAIWRSTGLGYIDAAVKMFNGSFTRFIPIWGWLKGMVMFTAEGNLPAAALCAVANVIVLIALGIFIWRMKPDFYEEAMAKTEETAELMAAAEESSGVGFVRRKKDRKESIRRNEFNKGYGANVFLQKSIYNRFRFAHLGFMTKTLETYGLIALLGGAGLVYMGAPVTLVIPLIIGAMAFYRALGSPLSADMEKSFFRLIPEKTSKKITYSLLGGAMDCFLDVLPAMLIAGIAGAVSVTLGNSPDSTIASELIRGIAWAPVIVSIDFYASAVGTFLGVCLPENISKMVRQFIMILFLYFGLLPDIGIMAVGIITGHILIAAILTAVINMLLGLLFILLASKLYDPLSEITPVQNITNGAQPMNFYNQNPSGQQGASWQQPMPYYTQPAQQMGTPQGYPGPTITQYFDETRAKKDFSAMALGLLIIDLITAVLQVVGVGIFPNAVDGTWGIWLLNFIPMYCVAVPLGLLFIQKKVQPATNFERKNLGVGNLIKAFFICFFLMYAGNFVGIGINALLERIFGGSSESSLDTLATGDNYIAQILFMAILAPIVEELIFRRFLIDRMRKYGEKLAVIASALLFGLFHGNLSQAIYATLLGLVLGYVYLRTGKMRYSVILHGLINFFGGVVSVFVASKIEGLEDLDYSNLEALASVDSSAVVILTIYGLFFIVGFIAGLVLLILQIGKVYYYHSEMEIPKGKTFSVTVVNVGMILFLILSALTMIAQIAMS